MNSQLAGQEVHPRSGKQLRRSGLSFSPASVVAGRSQMVLEFAAKLVKKHTNDLVDLSQTRNTSAGLMKQWSLDISIPDYKGASTGTKATISNGFSVPICSTDISQPKILRSVKSRAKKIQIVWL